MFSMVEELFWMRMLYSYGFREQSRHLYHSPWDTLWDLAQRFDTSVAELCELNGLSKDSA